jgi:hypothetical protein
MGGYMVTLYLIIQNSSKSMSTHGRYTCINPQHESNVTKCYQVLQIVTEMLGKYDMQQVKSGNTDGGS